MPILKIIEENIAETYSDGDQIEREILEYVRNNPAEDYSDVLAQDQRWPIFYHLTDMREGILNWYDFTPGCDVLEIGAGMGAITGLLCRKAGTVTSVELTLPRSRVIYERCKQYDNLKIMVGNFNRMKFPQQYDYITLIGVLEYAPGFTESGDPADFLRKIYGLLKPGGKLLIAIENRFGLKYWCGADEDHIGEPFFGINGYSEKSQVRTWSRSELTELLGRCGFEKQKFLYPLPDYKLPQVFYSDEYHPKGNLQGKVCLYRSNKEPTLTREEKLYEPVFENDAFPFMANSFFVECGRKDSKLCHTSAVFLSPERSAAQRVITVLSLKDHIVEKQAATLSAELHLQEIIDNQSFFKGRGLVPYILEGSKLTMPLLSGTSLDQIIYQHLSHGELEEVKTWISRFYECILESSDADSSSEEAILKNGFMEMNFQNCIVQNGEMSFYDQEWVEKNVRASFILFRAIRTFYTEHSDLQIVFPSSRLFSIYGFDEEKLKEYEEKECEFTRDILQKKANPLGILNSFRSCDDLLKLKDLIAAYRKNPVLEQQLISTQDQLLETQNQLADTKSQLADTKSQLADTKSQLTDTQSQLADTQSQLAAAQYSYEVISNAFFWKLTKPMRAGVDFLYRSPSVLLFAKGLKSLKNNGVHSTWIKVKRKLNNDNDYSKTLYSWQTNHNAMQEITVQSEEIKFSILVPLYNTPERFLHELIRSVQSQNYQNWELCLADGSDTEHTNIQEICVNYTKEDSRIFYQHLSENFGISNNTNKCAEMATGDYLVLLDHDDVLSPYALAANAQAILATNADVLYSDEDHLSTDGKYVNPFFKPDWSPDLLYCQMYICHLLVFRRELFYKVGGFRSEYDGSQDYDLMLRLSENTDKICHIPLVLYHWRESPSSTAASADSKPYAHEAGRKALDSHLKRVYGENTKVCDGEYTFVYDARFSMPKQLKVSIVIPMRDQWELTDRCVRSIINKSSYQNYEILILDNRSAEEKTHLWLEQIKEYDPRIRVLSADMEFNWSAINNYGVEKSTGDILVFLNNDTQVISEDWIERLSENALRKDIGVVGALLLYPDNTIQHAGVVVGIGGWADHIFKGMKPIHYGSPFVSPVLSRNVLAVTGACMAISREHFDDIGPFDEDFIICGSDIELCIRAHEKGLFNLFNSRVKLYHLESKSRNSYIPEIDFQKSYEVYKPYRENVDPYYNINLDTESTTPVIKLANTRNINYENYQLSKH